MRNASTFPPCRQSALASRPAPPWISTIFNRRKISGSSLPPAAGHGLHRTCIPVSSRLALKTKAKGRFAHVLGSPSFLRYRPLAVPKLSSISRPRRTCPTTTGHYFYECLPTTPSAAARDDRSALLLWQRSAVLPPLGLLPLALLQAKSRATTIFVNELDSGLFKRPSNDLQSCATRLARAGF